MTRRRPAAVPLTLDALLARTVEVPAPTGPHYRYLVGPCRLWTGATNTAGYGHVSDVGRTFDVHRAVWALANGWHPAALPSTLDDGALLVVTHACDVRTCCAVEHLASGRPEDNTRDMMTRGRFVAHNAVKAECHHGHPFDEANTYRRPDGRRGCRTCRRMAEATRTRHRRPEAT